MSDESFDNITICKNCGKMFEKYRAYHVFCSDACRDYYYMKKKKEGYKKKPEREKKCKYCGQVFVTNSRKKTYCSAECQRLALGKLYRPVEERTVTCLICQKVFKTRHQYQTYCCHNHYAQAQKERKRNDRVS